MLPSGILPAPPLPTPQEVLAGQYRRGGGARQASAPGAVIQGGGEFSSYELLKGVKTALLES